MAKTINLGRLMPNDLRIPLTNAVFYVRADGDDANDGLTEQTAKATLAATVADLQKYDLKGESYTFDVGPGSFKGFYISHTGLPHMILRGAGEQTRIRAQSTHRALRIWYISATIQDLLLEGSVYCVADGLVSLTGNIWFEPAVEGIPSLVYARHGGRAELNGATVVVRGTDTPPSTFVYAADAGSGITLRDEGSVTFENAVFTNAVVRAALGGTVSWHTGTTWSGDVTGKKYRCYAGGLIDCYDSLTEVFLPGSEPGDVFPYGLGGLAGVAQAAARVNSNGNISWSYNVASGEWVETGLYRLHLLRPHSANASVVASVAGTTPGVAIAKVILADHIDIEILDLNGERQNLIFSVQVM